MSQEQQTEAQLAALYEGMVENRLGTISPTRLQMAMMQVRMTPGLVSVGLPSGRAVRFSPMAEAVLHVTLTDIADAERAYLQPVADTHAFETFHEPEESLQAHAWDEGITILPVLQVRVPEQWAEGIWYDPTPMQTIVETDLPKKGVLGAG